MTFQASDTDIQSKQDTADGTPPHLTPVPFGVVIIATTINLAAGLAKRQRPGQRSCS